MAPFGVIAVDIAVAEFDRLRMCALGHDLFKMLIEFGNGIRQQFVFEIWLWCTIFTAMWRILRKYEGVALHAK